ncbi:hypothetical protein D9758_002961 [Tetrapyrgos nigripes]|uniref:60S ribosomal export protein NMD3 n=1 Tax=Tetrapyrgos nigripes TaxID=182062 RepID=A0A8H5LTP3_9AGAR|nr:hypothetical protein D9758_002961 [Tetrapyrgos nigripes]
MELLAICIKKLKGLNKVRLTEAHFIWTEPHSKRLRVSLTIQKEVLTNTILEQTFEIEYLVQYGQCPDCTRLAAKNTWKALVQVRQKVSHKRTFLFLEQLILKHSAQKDTISVKEVKDGLDFFYSQRSHAIKMVEFLNSVVPVRSKSSEQLLSSDTHSNTANYKFTYSVEIIPLCKDDLVCIPPKLARQLGNISPLTLCARIGNSVQLIDPATLQIAEVTSPVYWRAPFDSLATVSDLVEFTVLDIDPDGRTRGKHILADAQVALAGAFRSSRGAGKNDDEEMMDYESSGNTNQIFHTRTHLGAILQPGDTALGYFLTNSNYNSDDFASLPADRIPDIILVKKTYPNRRKKNKPRNWKLRSIGKEEGEEGETGGGRGVVGRMGGRDQKKVEEDYELFLRDLEEDEEMRGAVNLYKASSSDVKMKTDGKKGPRQPQYAMDVDEKSAVPEAEDEKEEEEADFPDIKLDELLEDFDEMTLGGDGEETSTRCLAGLARRMATEAPRSPTRAVLVKNLPPAFSVSKLLALKGVGGPIESIVMPPESNEVKILYVQTGRATGVIKAGEEGALVMDGQTLDVNLTRTEALPVEVVAAIALKSASRKIGLQVPEQFKTETALEAEMKRFGEIERIWIEQGGNKATVTFLNIKDALKAHKALRVEKAWEAHPVHFMSDRMQLLPKKADSKDGRHSVLLQNLPFDITLPRLLTSLRGILPWSNGEPLMYVSMMENNAFLKFRNSTCSEMFYNTYKPTRRIQKSWPKNNHSPTLSQVTASKLGATRTLFIRDFNDPRINHERLHKDFNKFGAIVRAYVDVPNRRAWVEFVDILSPCKAIRNIQENSHDYSIYAGARVEFAYHHQLGQMHAPLRPIKIPAVDGQKASPPPVTESASPIIPESQNVDTAAEASQ